MKSKLFTYACALASITTLLAACGGGGTGSSTAHDSTACISCHDNTAWATPGTGRPAVAEWKLSTHSTANAAGCADCHDDGYMHPASCTKCHSVGSLAKNPTTNPDRDGKCAKCHDKVNPRTVSDGYKLPFTDAHGNTITPNSSITSNTIPQRLFTVPTGVPLGVPAGSSTRFVHYSTGVRTNYVSSNYKNNCRKCHNPHDTAFGREQRKMWAESGHGLTRGLARIALDAKTRGSRITLDKNYGNGNYCVRCHTSTGFINFVNSDFTYIEALPDLNGFKSNFPEFAGSSTTYQDKSREATNCDVCHLDSTGTSSYSGKLRQVAVSNGVPIYYPYSTPGFKTSYMVRYDTLGSSNLCLTCHSGRATAKIITDAIDPIKGSNLRDLVFNNRKPAAPSVHDFAGGAVLQGEKSAFLFYTSPLKYTTAPAHRFINTDGNGPCVSCHMPKVQSAQTGGQIHSHLFRPVTWVNDDINESITDIISNATVCSTCHSGANAVTPDSMNKLRKGFRSSLVILSRIMIPTSSGPTNRYDWRSNTGNPNAGGRTYTEASVPRLRGAFPAAVYTMGASFNYGVLFNEPSAYNHTPILARQLIYDSIDWNWNGAVGFGTSPSSVYTAINSVNLNSAPNTWAKVNPVNGAINATTGNVTYVTFSNADKEDALEYLCKGYVRGTGQTTCNRW